MTLRFEKRFLVPNEDQNDNAISLEEAKAKLSDILDKLKASSEQKQPLDESVYDEALANFKYLTQLVEQTIQKDTE